MGKKLKHGALRKDKYYARAKNAGYRARSAYKLIQLNDKYQFLQKSRVCIDLCAAPGSWMQVAQKYMPVSSCIIGVDRFRISPLYGCICLEGDITTEKVRTDLKANLKTWKADVVLHDGAPSMGKNWIYDAYQQNLLVLHAFKLASEFLNRGGYFVSKVFRSKDYFKLEFILKKFFKKIEATKPSASRYESAEIFMVCQGFLAPDKVDPQFFNAKYVFHDLDLEPENKLDLSSRKKKKQQAEGYEEGTTIFFKKVKVSEFIHSESFLEVLRKAWELEFDDEQIKKHPLTTPDIIANCKDIKVLNRKDLKRLLNWRKKIKDEYTKAEEEKKVEEEEQEEGSQEETKDELEAKLEDLDKVEQQILSMEAEVAHEERKVLKKKRKLLMKERERIRLKTLIPGDQGPIDQAEMNVFSLNRLNNMKNVDDIVNVPANTDTTAIDDIDDDDEEEGERKMNIDPVHGEMNDNELDDDDENVFLTDLMDDDKYQRKVRRAELWFNKDIFKDVEDEADEDYGVDIAIEEYKSLGGELYNTESEMIKLKKKRDKKLQKVKNKEKVKKEKKKKVINEIEAELAKENPDEPKAKKAKTTAGTTAGPTGAKAVTDTEKDLGIDVGSGESEPDEMATKTHHRESDSDFEEGGGDDEDGINEFDDETVEIGPQLMEKEETDDEEDEENKLDPVSLSLATQMIRSAKNKRDILDSGWNRYMQGPETVPDWFAEDERIYNKPQILVEPTDLRMYRDREKNVNARTLKKVIEAKARKQRRMKKGMEKARKKAESIASNTDMTQREKVAEVRKLYKKAMKPMEKKERKYLVMKKFNQGKRPAGSKGPVKMVDRRMKKDVRAKLRVEARKKGGKRGKVFKGKGKGRGGK